MLKLLAFIKFKIDNPKDEVTARKQLLEAEVLYYKANCLQGQAISELFLGLIEYDNSKFYREDSMKQQSLQNAFQYFEMSLDLYKQIQERFGMAMTNKYLAQCCQDQITKQDFEDLGEQYLNEAKLKNY